MDRKRLLDTMNDAARSGATSLDLSSQGLTCLPPEIGQLTELQALRLGNNQLTSLGPEIGYLSRLTELDLSSNQLTYLPSDIARLTSLQMLFLSNNQLSSLPAQIGHLSALEPETVRELGRSYAERQGWYQRRNTETRGHD